MSFCIYKNIATFVKVWKFTRRTTTTTKKKKSRKEKWNIFFIFCQYENWATNIKLRILHLLRLLIYYLVNSCTFSSVYQHNQSLFCIQQKLVPGSGATRWQSVKPLLILQRSTFCKWSFCIKQCTAQKEEKMWNVALRIRIISLKLAIQSAVFPTWSFLILIQLPAQADVSLVCLMRS